MKDFVYEIVRRFEWRGYIIRLWISDDYDFDRDTIEDILADVNRHMEGYYDAVDLEREDAKEILLCRSEIAAIEIVDEDGSGVVVYREWP